MTTHILFCNGHGVNREWINCIMNHSLWLIEVDTLSLIQHCITKSLMERLPMTSFVSYFDHICHTAALEQDKIGWQNFVEGKISKLWGQLQFDYYHEIHLKQSMDSWTAGLVSHLLELVHRMLTHQNGIDHAVDE